MSWAPIRSACPTFRLLAACDETGGESLSSSIPLKGGRYCPAVSSGSSCGPELRRGRALEPQRSHRHRQHARSQPGPGGTGGNGLGGGIADLLSATTTVAGSTITQNEAIGGVSGGAGLGGGAYNDATSSLALTNSSVTRNEANGLPGIGGGVYNLGTFTFDAATVIALNEASTSNDNIFP